MPKMGFLLYLVVGILLIILLVGIIGLLLPEERIEKRETVLQATSQQVYEVVINNSDYHYRSDLKELKIVETDGEYEVWDEISKDGNVIRFKTREKKPYTFYSFDMKGKLFTGYWTAELHEKTDGKTTFVATEYIRMKNPFLKVLSYLFFDIGKFMEIYQDDLRRKLKENN